MDRHSGHVARRQSVGRPLVPTGGAVNGNRHCPFDASRGLCSGLPISQWSRQRSVAALTPKRRNKRRTPRLPTPRACDVSQLSCECVTPKACPFPRTLNVTIRLVARGGSLSDAAMSLDDVRGHGRSREGSSLMHQLLTTGKGRCWKASTAQLSWRVYEQCCGGKGGCTIHQRSSPWQFGGPRRHVEEVAGIVRSGTRLPRALRGVGCDANGFTLGDAFTGGGRVVVGVPTADVGHACRPRWGAG
mmetsp:Transcript_13126/g.40790  ORF Transcript_13126/g.40790 Transcript_13126/m.40790 type:complete len:245 (-) Transcript_13126:439-1173(-)